MSAYGLLSDNDSGEKQLSTEFSFQVNTLHGIVGSVEDVHIIDDTSFVIVGVFHDRNFTPSKRYGRITFEVPDIFCLS